MINKKRIRHHHHHHHHRLQRVITYAASRRKVYNIMTHPWCTCVRFVNIMEKTSGPRGGFLVFWSLFFSPPRPTPTRINPMLCTINLGRTPIGASERRGTLIVNCLYSITIPFNFGQGNNGPRWSHMPHGLPICTDNIVMYVFIYINNIIYCNIRVFSIIVVLLFRWAVGFWRRASRPCPSQWWLNPDLRRFGHETRYCVYPRIT